MKTANTRWHDGAVTPEDRAAALGFKGATVWLTGLPASGKSTLAVEVEALLIGAGRPALRLDGDNLRHGLNGNLGFSAEDRAENVRRTAHAAALLAEAGVVALVALVSPYKADRDAARAIHAEAGLPFLEVWVSTGAGRVRAAGPEGALRAGARRRAPGAHRRRRRLRGARVARAHDRRRRADPRRRGAPARARSAEPGAPARSRAAGLPGRSLRPQSAQLARSRATPSAISSGPCVVKEKPQRRPGPAGPRRTGSRGRTRRRARARGRAARAASQPSGSRAQTNMPPSGRLCVAAGRERVGEAGEQRVAAGAVLRAQDADALVEVGRAPASARRRPGRPWRSAGRRPAWRSSAACAARPGVRTQPIRRPGAAIFESVESERTSSSSVSPAIAASGGSGAPL